MGFVTRTTMCKSYTRSWIHPKKEIIDTKDVQFVHFTYSSCIRPKTAGNHARNGEKFRARTPLERAEAVDVDGFGDRASPHHLAPLHHRHVEPGPREVRRAHEAVVASAQHDHVPHPRCRCHPSLSLTHSLRVGWIGRSMDGSVDRSIGRRIDSPTRPSWRRRRRW